MIRSGLRYISLVFMFTSSVASGSPLEGGNHLDKTSLATLKFVAVVTRHGSRTPLTTYPNDPYPYTNRLFWPSGPKELTKYGKQQLYQTGINLRERFDRFLPNLFFPNETVAEYNNINRDFMSGACLLAGLYPPLGSSVWNRDLLWEPIPLNVRNFDVCGLPYGNRCPAYKTISDHQLKMLDNITLSDPKVSKFLSKVSSFTGANISGLSPLYDVYNTLSMQEENGFKLPGWAKGLYPEPMRSLATQVLLNQYSGSDEIIKLGAGPELKSISDMMNMKANGTWDENRKLYVEAAHDCTLIALLGAMSRLEPTFEVRTSAYLTFELHYIPDMYIVQVLYYENSTVTEPEQVNILPCPTPCSLQAFTQFVDTLNYPNWNSACNGETKKEEKSSWSFGI